LPLGEVQGDNIAGDLNTADLSGVRITLAEGPADWWDEWGANFRHYLCKFLPVTGAEAICIIS
jgi:hypothetical protein